MSPGCNLSRRFLELMAAAAIGALVALMAERKFPAVREAELIVGATRKDEDPIEIHGVRADTKSLRAMLKQ